LVNFDILYFSTDGCINKSLTYLQFHTSVNSDFIQLCFTIKEESHFLQILVEDIDKFTAWPSQVTTGGTVHQWENDWSWRLRLISITAARCVAWREIQ